MLVEAQIWGETWSYVHVTGVGGRDKNAMNLKETNSNKEPNAGGEQLQTLLSDKTSPCN